MCGSDPCDPFWYCCRSRCPFPLHLHPCSYIAYVVFYLDPKWRWERQQALNSAAGHPPHRTESSSLLPTSSTVVAIPQKSRSTSELGHRSGQVGSTAAARGSNNHADLGGGESATSANRSSRSVHGAYDLLWVKTFRPTRTVLLKSTFQLYRRPVVQLVLCSFFLVAAVAMYQFCEWFATFFTNHDSERAQTQSFVLFLAVVTCFQGFMKALGYAIDTGKLGSAPFYFMAELIVLVNYYAFYRNLFAVVSSPYVFGGLQVGSC